MEAIANRVAGGHRSQLLRSVSGEGGFFLRAAEAVSKTSALFGIAILSHLPHGVFKLVPRAGYPSRWSSHSVANRDLSKQSQPLDDSQPSLYKDNILAVSQAESSHLRTSVERG